MTNLDFMIKLFKCMQIILMITTFIACSETDANMNHQSGIDTENAGDAPMHYLILLDLSDRIMTTGQMERDQALILSLQQKFIDMCTQKHLLLESKDKFTLKIADQKNNPLGNRQTDFEEKLSLNLEAISMTEKRKAMDDFKAGFTENLQNLYLLASTYSDKRQYAGADLWGFLRDRIPDKRQDSLHLFIITDGYLDFENPGNRKQENNKFTDSRFLNTFRHKSDWQEKWTKEQPGIIAIPLDPAYHTAITLLEMYPKYDWQDEFPMLKRMWIEWGNAMGLSEKSIRIFRRDQTRAEISNQL